MIRKNGFLMHAGLVAVSAAVALAVWTRDKQPKALVASDVTIWQAKPKDVESITFDGKKKRVSLSAKKDDLGRYFTGTVEKEKALPKPPPPDAGPPDQPAAAEKTVVGLVSVGPIEKLLDLLAPLKAVRAVGQVPADREAEFGLNDPEGTLLVKLRESEKRLLIGGTTPGGGDRYVRDPANGEVYVIKGEVFSKVDTADSALMERDLHEWKDLEVASAKLVAGGKTRTIVRGGLESKRFWADEATRESADETLGNFMSKIDRLRPTDFPVEPIEAREVIVRVEYSGAGGPLGYLELVRGPAGDSGKPSYFVLSERTRVHGKVTGTVAEQVEQDVGSLVK
ncbi:MAG: DUF4340 domain-containing protein [Polyangiaceae bacterium]|nr:DUF4340 domain-containing protein [Polyangiaceae bacterium]